MTDVLYTKGTKLVKQAILGGGSEDNIIPSLRDVSVKYLQVS